MQKKDNSEKLVQVILRKIGPLAKLKDNNMRCVHRANLNS